MVDWNGTCYLESNFLCVDTQDFCGQAASDLHARDVYLIVDKAVHEKCLSTMIGAYHHNLGLQGVKKNKNMNSTVNRSHHKADLTTRIGDFPGADVSHFALTFSADWYWEISRQVQKLHSSATH